MRGTQMLGQPWRWAVALALSVGLAACTPPSAAPPTAAPAAPAPSPVQTLTTVRLAAPTMDLNYVLPLAVAEHKGYFREAGIHLEAREMPSPAAIAALVNREIDIGCHTCAIEATARGADLRFVFAPYNTSTFQFMVHPDRIREPRDLVGQAIAIASHGNAQDVATRLMLASLGIDPLSVNYIALGGDSGRVAGLLSGQIAGSALNPSPSIIVRREGFVSIANSYKVMAIPWSGYGVRASYIAEQGATLQGWLRAMVQALQFIRQSPAEAADLVSQVTQLDADLTRESVALLVETMDPDDPGGWTEAGLQEQLRLIKAQTPELDDAALAPERVADARPLRQAQQALGIRCRGGVLCD